MNDGAPWFTPYAGYQHFIPRAASWVVASFTPISWWAIAITIAACLLTGLVCGLVYLFSRDVLDVRVCRFGLAIIPALVPIAGHEVAGNLANIHWYFFYLVPWLLLATPRSFGGAVAMTLLAASVALTETQSIIFVPLSIWLVARRRRSRAVNAAFLLGMTVQVITYLTTSRERGPGFPPLMSTIEGYVLNVSLSPLAPGNEGEVVATFGWVIASISVLLFVACGAYAFLGGSNQVRLAVIVLLVGSAASWTIAFVFNNTWFYFYSEIPIDQLPQAPLIRWGTAGSMMLISMVPLAVGIHALRRPRRGDYIGIGLISILIGLMAVGFSVTPHPRVAPSWTEQLEAARALCTSGTPPTAQAAVAPAGWSVVFRATNCCSHTSV